MLGVDDDYDNTDVPAEFTLYPAFPNPFNSSVTFDFNLPIHQQVSLQLFDQNGRLVETLVDERLGVGRFSAVWNADRQAAGVYFYRLQTGDFQQTNKLTLIK